MTAETVSLPTADDSPQTPQKVSIFSRYPSLITTILAVLLLVLVVLTVSGIHTMDDQERTAKLDAAKHRLALSQVRIADVPVNGVYGTDEFRIHYAAALAEYLSEFDFKERCSAQGFQRPNNTVGANACITAGGYVLVRNDDGGDLSIFRQEGSRMKRMDAKILFTQDSQYVDINRIIEDVQKNDRDFRVTAMVKEKGLELPTVAYPDPIFPKDLKNIQQ